MRFQAQSFVAILPFLFTAIARADTEELTNPKAFRVAHATVAEIMAHRSAPRARANQPWIIQGDRRLSPAPPPGADFSPGGPHISPMQSSLPDPAIIVGSSFLAEDLNEQITQTNQSGFWTAPSACAAVGPDQILVFMNGRLRVFDKSGNLGALDVFNDDFWQPTGQVDTAHNFSENPRAIFDPLSKRFIVCMDTTGSVDGSSPVNDLLLAVTDGPHISQSTTWTYFAFAQDFGQTNGDTGMFAFRPSLSADPNAIIMGCDMFGPSGYYSSSLFVIPKNPILAGTPKALAIRDIVNQQTGAGPRSPWGVSGVVTPFTGQSLVIGFDKGSNGQIDLIPILHSGSFPSAGKTVTFAIPGYKEPINVTTLGSTNPLGGGDSGLLSAQIVKSEFSGNYSILGVHNVGTDNTGAAVASPTQNSAQWFRIDPIKNTLVAVSTFYDPAGNSVMYPSIAMSETDALVMGYGTMGPNLRPVSMIARQVPGDPIWALVQVAGYAWGNADYNVFGNPQSWGHYTTTYLDPTDGMTVWTCQEYDDPPQYSIANGSWAVRVGQIKAPPPPAISSISPVMVAHGYSGTVDITGTPTKRGQAFSEPSSALAGTRQNMAITFNGNDLSGSTTPSAPSPTVARIKLLATQTNVGSYVVGVTNPDGQPAGGGATLTIVPAISQFTISPATIVGGKTAQGTITLEQKTTVAEPITLGATPANGPVTLPQTTVPAGSSTLPVSIPTLPVAAITSVTVSATDPGAVHSLRFKLTITPDFAGKLLSVGVSPAAVTGGTSATGTVTISAAAPQTGLDIAVRSDTTAAAQVTSPVHIAAGATSASFPVSSLAVSTTANVTITAQYGAVTVSAPLKVSEAAITSFTGTPNPVAGGTQVQAKLALSGVAGPNGDFIALSSNSSAASVPANITVPSGSNNVSFAITTQPVTSSIPVTITATSGPSTRTLALTVQTFQLASITPTHPAVYGGFQDGIQVSLNGNSPSGSVVNLSSSDTSILTVPSTTTIPAGQISVAVNASTFAVDADANATITGTLDGVTKSATVAVKAAILMKIVPAKTSLQGGTSTTATLFATGPAASPIIATLTSSDPSVLQVPSSASIASGSTTTLAISVTTNTVAAPTQVTITASYKGGSVTAVVTVTP